MEPIRAMVREIATTGLNADRLVRQCLTGIAVHRMGLEGDYLSPLSVEDDR